MMYFPVLKIGIVNDNWYWFVIAPPSIVQNINNPMIRQKKRFIDIYQIISIEHHSTYFNIIMDSKIII